MPRSQSKPVRRRDLVQCLHEILEIMQRFPHSHDDHIGHEFADFLACQDDLIDDFSRRQISFEALFSRCAEDSMNLASHLGADADGIALWRPNQHGFNRIAIPQLREPLDGLVVVFLT